MSGAGQKLRWFQSARWVEEILGTWSWDLGADPNPIKTSRKPFSAVKDVGIRPLKLFVWTTKSGFQRPSRTGRGGGRISVYILINTRVLRQWWVTFTMSLPFKNDLAYKCSLKRINGFHILGQLMKLPILIINTWMLVGKAVVTFQNVHIMLKRAILIFDFLSGWFCCQKLFALLLAT